MGAEYRTRQRLAAQRDEAFLRARVPAGDRAADRPQSPKLMSRSRAVMTVSFCGLTTFMRPTAASSGW